MHSLILLLSIKVNKIANSLTSFNHAGNGEGKEFGSVLSSLLDSKER